MPRTRVSFEMRQKARALRVHATKGESLLWYELRELKSAGIKFRRQCPIGPYIVDFACLAVKLVVEVDGDLHEQERGKRHDAVRDAYLRSLGFDVFRVDEPDVINSAWHVAQVVKEKVARMFGDLTRPLRGHPPLKGEGNAGALRHNR
ncbi:MAG: endonuclease domain-containing protein [Mesorhizobium sp.]|uniref:endonuclease domain-containing protein n=1 Tax=Mesorhizobium sp. TaxID=1871066 RepID=UPI00121D979E|nr:endonuclease domain-containing protein [Mesorhizobium sp.]TIL72723.1 MAG: endonuclease domain-containing protein [Mesorhizobium sp.]TIL90933.1 MAG: endonuclease domain-containing protein [Mesorhizobium sp.]TIM00932.1 MAG: endonuclease domain-containing protein [Mesorhizobium sp.]